MYSNLKEFQKRAVRDLIDKCSELLDKPSRQKICVFCSPTGSGKTIMASKCIEGLLKRREDELCFVWVTIGKGELHIQTHNALKRLFNGSPKVSLLEDEFFGSRDEIGSGEVVVVNWNKLYNKDSQTGEWKNILMKDGEKINFREVLANTRAKRKIILIVDESHVGATAERTSELKSEIDADVILEVSATPKFKPTPSEMASGNAGWIQVPASDVIEEGLIKKEIIINQDLDEFSEDETDSQQAVLEMAFRKRLEIQEAFDRVGADINPLVLIQIPNADAGQLKLNAVIDFLASKDVTEENSRLAIWLNNYPSSENLDGIADNTNPIQYLVFKQAIDTGWDCPRAQILVKFRETRSETFEIQVIGRILRMPEQKHYSADILNNGYIYTNIQDIIVKREDFNPNTIKHIKSTRRSNYQPIELPSYYKSRADYGDITSGFVTIFLENVEKYFDFKQHSLYEENISRAESKGLVLNISNLKDSLSINVEVETEKFDDIEGLLEGSATTDLTLSGNDTQTAFNRYLEEHMDTFTNVRRSVPVMKSAFYAMFKQFFGDQRKRQDAMWLQKIVLHRANREIFSVLLTKSVSDFAISREKEVKQRVESGEQNYIFEVPSDIYVNENVDKQFEAKKYVMEPCYLNIERSKPEREFEKRLEADGTIEWWFKNGVNKIEYLGIKYEYPANKIKTFYPDYLVKYLDGSIGVFETKSDGDDENLGGLNIRTAKKAEALAEWKNKKENVKKKIRTGIVIVKGSQILINESAIYRFDSAIKGDWTDWKPFLS
jgi:type III restriction enzyme